MAEIKLTKTELRSQQVRLSQLEKYLPTLQLKKAMLQSEVQKTVHDLADLEKQFDACLEKVEKFTLLFTHPLAEVLFEAVKIEKIKVSFEYIAGLELPHFDEIEFAPFSYSLIATPVWMESAILDLKELIRAREKRLLLRKRRVALEKELREVSIRVNLFEKIMIPRSIENIKKIKIFLGDQALAAVAQAKVSKGKILLRKSLVNR